METPTAASQKSASLPQRQAQLSGAYAPLSPGAVRTCGPATSMGVRTRHPRREKAIKSITHLLFLLRPTPDPSFSSFSRYPPTVVLFFYCALLWTLLLPRVRRLISITQITTITRPSGSNAQVKKTKEPLVLNPSGTVEPHRLCKQRWGHGPQCATSGKLGTGGRHAVPSASAARVALCCCR
jgi:hypothetical protein